MRFEFGFYSSMLLIFFVHGIVYALLLFRKGIKNESASDKWLALFLLLCVLYIAPWMLGFGGWYDNQPYRDILFYTPLQHLFFMGPVIFFYVQSLLNPSFKFGRKEWLHLLPGILYLLYSLVIIVTDKIILKKYYFLADGMDRDFDGWYQKSGLISMVLYFIISLRYYKLYKKLMVQVISYADTVLFKWVKNFLFAFLLMQLLQVVFYIFSFIFPALDSYIGSWWFFFSFAIVFYYIAITGYSNSIETKVPFKLNLLTYKPSLLLENFYPENSTDTFIEDAEIIEIEKGETEKKPDIDLLDEWKSKISVLLESEKIYEDPELSLTQVAKQLKTNPSLLSKIINQGFQLNFNDFINNYRITAVKEKLQAGEQKTQTLLGIAYDCGFNSKATFNRAFKKATGASPKEWLKKNE
ncbi:helix-turn-helix domain-containing protein [Ferruginibacter sp.]